MRNEQRDEGANQELTISLVIMSLCAMLLGFFLSFFHSSRHSGLSVLAPKMWIDHYFDLMTHPVYVIVEIAIPVWAMWKLRGWRFVACSGLLGGFFGTLIQKTLFVARR
jgi:hypothetical protein